MGSNLSGSIGAPIPRAKGILIGRPRREWDIPTFRGANKRTHSLNDTSMPGTRKKTLDDSKHLQCSSPKNTRSIYLYKHIKPFVVQKHVERHDTYDDRPENDNFVECGACLCVRVHDEKCVPSPIRNRACYSCRNVQGSRHDDAVQDRLVEAIGIPEPVNTRPFSV